MLMTACGNNQQALVIGEPVFVGEQTMVEVAEPATPGCPAYVVVNNPEVDLAAFPVDKDGYHVLFIGNESLFFIYLIQISYPFKMDCRGRMHQILRNWSW